MSFRQNPTMEELNFLFRKKWTLCILTDMHLGSKHFQDFNKNLPDISTKVLNQTLTELEEVGLISKKIIKEYYGYIARISSNSKDDGEILKRIEQL